VVGLVVDLVSIDVLRYSSSLFTCLTYRSLVFTATFGPGGFRTTRTVPLRRRDQANRTEPAERRSLLTQLLPLIFIFIFYLLPSIPSLFSSTPIPDPRFSFTPSAQFNVERQTGGLGIKYHVNRQEFLKHPHLAAELATADARNKKGQALSRFEGNVERVYTRELYTRCQIGLQTKERRKDAEIGIFGLGTDWDKVRQIETEVVESCEELRRFGF